MLKQAGGCYFSKAVKFRVFPVSASSPTSPPFPHTTPALEVLMFALNPSSGFHSRAAQWLPTCLPSLLLCSVSSCGPLPSSDQIPISLSHGKNLLPSGPVGWFCSLLYGAYIILSYNQYPVLTYILLSPRLTHIFWLLSPPTPPLFYPLCAFTVYTFVVSELKLRRKRTNIPARRGMCEAM